MKIALGQIDMVWEEKEQSFQKAEQMIKEAAKKRFRLASGCMPASLA